MNPSPKPTVGIYGTDLTQPASHLIEQVRSGLAKLRGQLSDVRRAYGWDDRIEHVEGALTCCLVALADSNEDIITGEVKRLDHERGRSLQFSSRGIGLDVVPACFICGKTQRTDDPTKSTYLHNIAAFVKSREEGEEIARWFMLPDLDCARVDFRPSEPTWIQVKIGVCDAHLPALEWLHKTVTANHGRIREQDVKDARAHVAP